MAAKKGDGEPGRRRTQRFPTRSKIVATLGPATSRLTQIRALIRAGADVFRINFSHGTTREHDDTIRRVRRAARLEERPIAILADLQGPKIRVGGLADGGPILLKRGERLVIVPGDAVQGVPGRIGCSYAGLARDVRKGDRILLDDGSLELRVERVESGEVHTKVRYGGLLREHKGINLPGTAVQAPSLGGKDLYDLDLALTQGVDYVALSFVRNAGEITQLRDRIRKFGSDAEVIAKIERPEAVEALPSIIAVADGVMVARGDMGVELGVERVPAVQKRAIQLCIAAAKPVITATQMLESMVLSPRPTRAEASDVANAIYDGTSALMLSAETATGKYPTLVVKTMDRIARRTEADIFAHARRHPARLGSDPRGGPRQALSIGEAAVSAAARAAMEADAAVVCTFTETGRTARLVARERLGTRLVAFTPSDRTYCKLALHWGIIPMLIRRAQSVQQMLRHAEAALLASRHARPGDRVVFLAGTVQVAGATNAVTIREVGRP